MQVIDFEALRLKSALERRRRLQVLPGGEGGEAPVLLLPSALKRWASEAVNSFLPEPDPGPSAA